MQQGAVKMIGNLMRVADFGEDTLNDFESTLPKSWRKLIAQYGRREVFAVIEQGHTIGGAMNILINRRIAMMKDFPFDKVVERAIRHIENGANVYQKFTCAGCGHRLTMDTPNKFFETGTCDRCPAVTDIRKRGCNFLLHYGAAPREAV